MIYLSEVWQFCFGPHSLNHSRLLWSLFLPPTFQPPKTWWRFHQTYFPFGQNFIVKLTCLSKHLTFFVEASPNPIDLKFATLALAQPYWVSKTLMRRHPKTLGSLKRDKACATSLFGPQKMNETKTRQFANCASNSIYSLGGNEQIHLS